jgi:FkbM family methyltransferase
VAGLTTGGMITEIRELARAAGGVETGKALTAQMNNYSKIIIYGAGNVGRNCAVFMQNKGFEIECFLDVKAECNSSFMNRPVYAPDDARLGMELRGSALVVLSLVMEEKGYTALEYRLREMGYSHFANAFYHLGLSREFYVIDEDEISDAFELMADEHSKDVFMSVFRAHALSDYKLPIQSPGMIEYVDVNVPFRHNYKFFVDCGAFTGDSLANLVTKHRVEHYLGFEPDPLNYKKLLKSAGKLRDRVERLTLFPLGVSDKNENLKFHATGGSGSRIDEYGEYIIQTVCLDNILIGHNELMIKMDVEGYEIAALYGSKRLITETAPDLAVCVYHNITDLWRIPLLIKEWMPEYRFYMRNHGIGTLGTVMYAAV